MVRRWQAIRLVGAAREQVPILCGETDRPSCIMNFDTMFLSCLLMRMGKNRWICCSPNTQNQNSKYKHQSRFLSTNSDRRRVWTPGHQLLRTSLNHSATWDLGLVVCLILSWSKSGPFWLVPDQISTNRLAKSRSITKHNNTKHTTTNMSQPHHPTLVALPSITMAASAMASN